jgi:signal transduction histidine kinase
MPVRRKDGSVYKAAVSITPLRNEEGQVIAFVGSLTDISAMKEVERMKDMFVSNVSHELRTPIASLKLNRDLLQRDPGRSEVYIARLGREIARLNGIVEDLLRLARLDQGGVGISIGPCDLNRLAEKLVVDREPLAEDKGLSIALDAESDLPLAQADEGLLEQALSVFLTNSLNYTPAGGQITVLTQSRQEDDVRWVGAGVRDTGPGIPPDEQRHLFERFFRGKTGRDSGTPGTGLGLAIAHEIVKRHDGQIELISEGKPGKGSTFLIWLPIHFPEEDSGEG